MVSCITFAKWILFSRIFFRVLLFEKYFFGLSVSAKVIFWVVQKYPAPPIPVCRFVKSIPWVLNMTGHARFGLSINKKPLRHYCFLHWGFFHRARQIMLSCGHFFAKNYKSPGWITFCLRKVKVNNIEIFISTSDKLDVIVFGIQFYSQLILSLSMNIC